MLLILKEFGNGPPGNERGSGIKASGDSRVPSVFLQLTNVLLNLGRRARAGDLGGMACLLFSLAGCPRAAPATPLARLMDAVGPPEPRMSTVGDNILCAGMLAGQPLPPPEVGLSTIRGHLGPGSDPECQSFQRG